jgi:hypothetical protein
MRVSTAFSRLLRLKGVWVKTVRFERDRVVVGVALRRRRLVCPEAATHRKLKRAGGAVWRAYTLKEASERSSPLVLISRTSPC